MSLTGLIKFVKFQWTAANKFLVSALKEGTTNEYVGQEKSISEVKSLLDIDDLESNVNTLQLNPIGFKTIVGRFFKSSTPGNDYLVVNRSDFGVPISYEFAGNMIIIYLPLNSVIQDNGLGSSSMNSVHVELGSPYSAASYYQAENNIDGEHDAILVFFSSAIPEDVILGFGCMEIPNKNKTVFGTEI